MVKDYLIQYANMTKIKNRDHHLRKVQERFQRQDNKWFFTTKQNSMSRNRNIV